ncbi:MAG: glycoside hydrolase family 43 protein [Clostridia bacterium]|nr:glycoside hydrolase family 43 protein [Clostridia bacterium]
MKLAKFLRYITAIFMVGINLWNYAVNDYAWPVVSKDGAYLMVYFVGNAPEEQTIHMAVSEDGYNFAALNNNETIIEQTMGTGCVRDPYIYKTKDEEGKDCYYIVATDMDAMQGWTSNHAIIFWKSYDLVNWEDEFVLDFRTFEGWEGCNRAWAPQIIYDETVGKHMVYLALSTWDDPNTPLNEDCAQHYYVYTEDFKTFTQPEYLYGRRGEVATNADGWTFTGVQCIDGDMIYDEKDDCYYLYFKEDLTQKIAYVKAKTPRDFAKVKDTDYTIVSLNYFGVEGSFMYNITGTNKWIMFMDEYSNGTFFAQMTSDFENFRQYRRALYSVDHLRPRHGSVTTISMDEYERLIDAYGASEIPAKEKD